MNVYTEGEKVPTSEAEMIEYQAKRKKSCDNCSYQNDTYENSVFCVDCDPKTLSGFEWIGE